MEAKEIKWLKTKAGILKIDRIEEELGMAQGTLKKYVDDKRSLADHWKPKVVEWVKKFKK